MCRTLFFHIAFFSTILAIPFTDFSHNDQASRILIENAVFKSESVAIFTPNFNNDKSGLQAKPPIASERNPGHLLVAELGSLSLETKTRVGTEKQAELDLEIDKGAYVDNGDTWNLRPSCDTAWILCSTESIKNLNRPRESSLENCIEFRKQSPLATNGYFI